MITAETLARKVLDVLDEQALYFQDRDPKQLKKCKAQEKQLRELCERCIAGLAAAPDALGLFSAPEEASEPAAPYSPPMCDLCGKFEAGPAGICKECARANRGC